MSESEELIYNLLYDILKTLPAAESLLYENITRGEMSEILRLNDSKLFEAYQDFALAFESLAFIMSDYQLRLKAADIWKQQLEVFRQGLSSRAADLKKLCQENGIDIEKHVNAILNY